MIDVIERLRVALLSYGAWLVALLFPFVGCALFLIGYPERRYLSLSDYFFFMIVLVVPLPLLIGFQLKTQLGLWRSKLIPGWTAAHISLAVGMCVVLAGSVVCIVGFSLKGNLEIGAGESTSAAAILALVCLELLLSIFVGFWMPLLIAFIPMVFGALAYKGSVFYPLLLIFIKGQHPRIVWMCLLGEFLGGIALVRRMLQTQGQQEFQSSFFDYGGAQRRYLDFRSADRGFRHRLTDWNMRPLDAIPHPLAKDLRSQVRHFQWGFSVGRLWLSAPIVTIFILSILRRVIGFPHQELIFWYIAGNSFVFQTMITRDHSRPWVFMLPLRRREIVLRYLGARFISILKVWLGCMVAVFVVDWVPFPGTIGALPSLWSFVESFAMLIPLFGILSLVLLRPGKDNAGMVVIASVAMTIAVAVLFIRTTHAADPVPVFLIAGFITGIGLIWYSYRCWLRADLD